MLFFSPTSGRDTNRTPKELCDICTCHSLHLPWDYFGVSNSPNYWRYLDLRTLLTFSNKIKPDFRLRCNVCRIQLEIYLDRWIRNIQRMTIPNIYFFKDSEQKYSIMLPIGFFASRHRSRKNKENFAWKLVQPVGTQIRLNRHF